jgi:hypothetical protein
MSTPERPVEERHDPVRAESTPEAMRHAARATTLCALVGSMSDEELDMLEPLALSIVRERHAWAKHAADRKWHSVAAYAKGSVVTRCRGRWELSEPFETAPRPLSADRCPPCQDAYVASRIAGLTGTAISREMERVELGLAELRDAPAIGRAPAVRFTFDTFDAEEPPRG